MIERDDSYLIGQDFGRGVASWFGLDENKVTSEIKMHTELHKPFAVTLTICLSAEDVIGIGKRMEAMREMQPDPLPQEDLSAVPYPVFSSEEARARYNALSKEERSRYGSFARFAQGAPLREESKVDHYMHSVEEYLADPSYGRKVSHIDAPEEEDKSGTSVVPSLWIKGSDIDPGIYHMACDYKRDDDGEIWCLMLACVLTEEQRQKAKEAKP